MKIVNDTMRLMNDTKPVGPAIALLALMSLGSIGYAANKGLNQFTGRVLQGLVYETATLYAGGVAMLAGMAFKDKFMNPTYPAECLFSERPPRRRFFGLSRSS